MNDRIAAINLADVHRITSGQVIVDLTSAVKELIDNSIDSGADQIECVFKNYGMESFECSDNGSGISEENYESLALKHYTSKISSYQDVSKVTTLGFRGEALSSLSAIAKISVITTTSPPKAAKLEFDFAGNLVKKSVTSRNRGTSVQVSHLFNNLPVRKKEFTKNHKRQFNKCISLLQAYTIIEDSIKISIWHITSNGRKSLVLSSTKSQGLSKRILSVFGSSGMQGLSELNLELDLNSSKPQMSKMYTDEPFWKTLDYKITITGFISKNSFGCGRNARDRQFIFINKRPVEHHQLIKCCNEVYRTFNNVQYPALFLNFKLPPELLDINVTPDKRTVLLHNEELVLDALRERLGDYYSSQEMVLPVGTRIKSSDNSDQLLKKRRLEQPAEQIPLAFEEDENQQNIQDNPEKASERLSAQEPIIVKDFIRNENSNESSIAGVQVTLISPKEQEGAVQTTLDSFANPSSDKRSLFVGEPNEEIEDIVTVVVGDEKVNEKAVMTRDNNLVFTSQGRASTPACGCQSVHEHAQEVDSHQGSNVDNGESEIEEEDREISSPVELNVRVSMPTSISPSRNLLKGEGISTPQLQSLSITVVTDIESISAGFQESLKLSDGEVQNSNEKKIQKNEQLENFDEGENYLTLTVSKSDFREMCIVGQFNLGFILATRKLDHKFDLFILDQHASDEKFNFEMLQKTTIFKSQRLIAPQPIEMSIIDELIVMDNLAVFERNGFKLEVDENQPQGSRVKLISLPVSKRTVFDSSDLNELIHLVKETDGLNKSNVRCSKIRAMFAMRACRSSIMVGKPLTRKAMTRVVRNLSELDKPWNCPHGRPTMRHLMELRDWDSFKKDYEL